MDIIQNQILTMSNKEANRIAVLDRLNKKEIKQIGAAEALGLSVRQIKRLIRNYRKTGIISLIHGNRGKISNHRVDQKSINEVLEIIKTKYFDFGPTLAHEKLLENNQINFSVEKLRLAMIDCGLWTQKQRKRITVHQLRERRKCIGELVQIDGSPHKWFENRGEECNLLVFIDDATSKLMWLEFCHSETTMAYLRATKGYLKLYGKPLAFYSDRHSIFKMVVKSSEDESTQFGRAMEELSIKIICANSPQAKGRVERSNQTLQDRLVKELRLKDINTMEEANKFMPEFIKIFNQKFGVTPALDFNAHKPLTEIESKNIDRILAVIKERTLSKNLTCQLDNQYFQVKTDKSNYVLRNAKVKIIKDIGGNIQMEYHGRKLEFTIFNSKPSFQAEIVGSKLINNEVNKLIRKPTVPSAEHPWRKFNYGANTNY
jgi:transposase